MRTTFCHPLDLLGPSIYFVLGEVLQRHRSVCDRVCWSGCRILALFIFQSPFNDGSSPQSETLGGEGKNEEY